MKTGGAADDVTDQEIRDGIQLLAETEGSSPRLRVVSQIGVTKKLVDPGRSTEGHHRDRHHGNGLKTPEAVNLRNLKSSTRRSTLSRNS